MQDWLYSLLSLLALPEYGLGTLFVVSFLSATLLPMGSEPALFGLVKLNADVTLVFNTKVVDQVTYNALMTRWNSFVMEPAFQAAMKAIVPSTGKK